MLIEQALLIWGLARLSLVQDAQEALIAALQPLEIEVPVALHGYRFSARIATQRLVRKSCCPADQSER
jgi:hypothetical protein